MPALLLYLLKVNVALVLFYLAYHFALRRLTFYHLNRLFLLFGIVFSTLYPLIDLSELFNRHQELANAYIVTVPVWFTDTAAVTAEQGPALDYWLIPLAIFWLGTAVMGMRLLLQFISLYKIHAASEPKNYKGISFRKIEHISQAFSFWQTIYLNPTQHKQEELESILQHEQIHVKGWHTVDVLLAELSTVFYWFNPGVWLMKKAVKENLEFIADHNVVNTGIDKKEYQYLLLKVVGATQPQIANQFNFPSLKRRIAMMNKMPTHRANQLRLLIALPLVTVLLFAFRSASEPVENLVDKITLSDTSDKESKAGEQGTDPGAIDAYKAFYARNPDVKELSWRSNNKIVVKLKSGEEEVYTYGDKQTMAVAEKKYGNLPSSPPVVKRDAESAAKQQDGGRIIFPADIDYYQKEENLPENYKNFLKRNQTVEKVGWKIKDSKGPEAIVILLKSGKTETYNYNDKKGMAAAENKYGKLPDLLPPPPPVRAEVPGTPPPPPAEPTPPTPPAPPAGEDLPAPPPPLPEGTLVYKPAHSNQHEDHKAFLKRNSEINEIGWIAREDNGRNLRLLILYLKDGKSEIIDLNNEGSIARAEKIYGKLPGLPAPPPPVRKSN